MKKILSLILILPLCLSLGCNKKSAKVVDVLTSDGTQQTVVPTATDIQSSAPAAKSGAFVEVTGTVAYVFDGAEGVTIYGAAEYTNTGDTPVTLTSATFDFSVGARSISYDFTPMLAQYDIVMPGKSAFVVLWLKDSSLTPGTPATLSANLTCAASAQDRYDLEVENIYLADNYPDFTTLSGTLRNLSGNECSMNMLYVGFYDKSGALLGVWNFTRNAQLEPYDTKSFVVNMKELTIADLAANTASARGTAFGFN